MRAIQLVVAALLATMVAGCAGQSKFVGTWEGQMSQQGMSATVTQTFNADKTFTGTMTMEVPQMGKVSAKVNGTWESKKDDEVTMTLTSAEVLEAPPMVKDAFKAGIEKEKGKPDTNKIEWKSNDEMVMTGKDGNPVTFRRK